MGVSELLKYGQTELFGSLPYGQTGMSAPPDDRPVEQGGADIFVCRAAASFQQVAVQQTAVQQTVKLLLRPLALVAGFALLGVGAASSGFAAVSAPSAARQEKDSDPGPIKPIMEGMHGAEARLKRGDTGAGTRTIQEKVVNDLQKLIDAAKSKPRGGSQQPNSGTRQESGSQNRPQPQGSPTSETPSGSTGAGQPGRKPGAGKFSTGEKEKKPTDSPQRPLLREVWGHLPPALRERVPSDFHETILPAYDDLVRRYFEALLNGSSPAGPDRLPTQALPAQ